MGSESEEERPAPGTTKKNSASERDKHRAQKYRPDWEKLHLFKDWLGPGKNKFKDIIFNISDKIDVLSMNTDEFWGDIKKQYENYKTLAQFAINLLCLPHSSADCERAFSEVNLIKTKFRNSLSNETLNGTLLAKQRKRRNGNCTKFKPTKEMLKNMTTENLYK